MVHDTSAESVKEMLAGVDLENMLDKKPVTAVLSDPKFNGDDLIDKTGATSGFRAYIAVIPNKKTGIVILTNKHDTGAAIAVAGREILFKLNGIKG